MQVLTRKRAFGSIEVLRLIAALGVMLSHVGYSVYYTKGFSANIGVYLFFCISAFLMMHNSEQTPPAKLLVKRLIRLIPLYWILTILTFAASFFISGFGQENISIDQLVKSLLFIPYTRDGMLSSDVIRPIVGPAWTINYDFWFLLIFVASTKINRKYRGLIASLACIAVCFGSELLPGSLAATRFMNREVWLYYIVGIVVYELWTLTRNANFKLKQLPALNLAICIVLLGVLYFVPHTNLIRMVLCGTILFITLFAFEKSNVPGFVTWFGTISYSFYLTHYYVVMILSFFFDFKHLTVMSVLGTLAVLLISLLVSQISYFILEKKAGNFLKEKLSV